VTGANGFIGSALCQVLSGQEYTVIAALRKQPFQKELKPAFAVVGDIHQKTDWSHALANVDTVIHLAARVHVMEESVTKPLDLYREVNVQGTLNLAKQAVKAGVTRFIFASSIKVLGEERDKPYTHRDNPNPVDDYALSKWEAEQGLQQIVQHQAMDAVILRFPLVYGEGVKANFLRLMQWVDKGVPLPLKAVNNRRSLLYLGNLLDAIHICCQHPKAGGNTFLISDGDDLSTAELIQRLGDHLKPPSARLFSIPPKMLNRILILLGKRAEARRLLGSLCVDNHHICSTLDWQPPYSVDEGLANTFVHYKNT
jgi:UDP-glucose 4-epimerase